MSSVIQTNFQYRKPLIPLDLDNVNYIIVHHPAWKTASPQEIHDDVLNDMAKITWNGFPYNEYIRKDGTVYIGRGDHIGSQCAGMNSSSYGIACEGDYDTEMVMPEVQKQALVERIKYNRPRFPNYKLTAPHSQFSATSCPGKWFPMTEILKRIEVVNVTIEEALKILVDKGVINSPDFWKGAVNYYKHVDELIISIAKKLQ